jgi:putative spermidine/putrescine transport system permease protein
LRTFLPELKSDIVMTQPDANAIPLAADGRPLEESLRRALRRQKLRALMLISPLLLFVLLTFVAPIADMLYRSIDNAIVSETLPRTVVELETWEESDGIPPGSDTFSALYYDLYFAAELKTHTRLGSRLNYQQSGISSLFRKTGRRVDRFETDDITKQFIALDEQWKSPVFWQQMAQSKSFKTSLPETASAWQSWVALMAHDEKQITEDKIEDVLYFALYRDLIEANTKNISADYSWWTPTLNAVANFEKTDIVEQFVNADEDWLGMDVWGTLKRFSPKTTSGYFLNALDLQKTNEGIQAQPENTRIYYILFIRTLVMSLSIMAACILLAYPVAYLLSNLPMRKANLILILVLLPFWTSLLVRTSAWKVLLQQQGVINDLLVWVGLVDDANRLVMMNNQVGTIIAMTHILLPFMILPMYSVMRTIPPSYVRAAKSLGATNWTAFWRVYFPQSIPGIGAGSILVFIMSIGYYITPAIVGGTQGIFISNRIAYHISSSLNWGLASALGAILLAIVTVIYWLYDKHVGIDNIKLG